MISAGSAICYGGKLMRSAAYPMRQPFSRTDPIYHTFGAWSNAENTQTCVKSRWKQLKRSSTSPDTDILVSTACGHCLPVNNTCDLAIHIYIYLQVVNYRLLAPVIVSVYIVRLLERWLLRSTILNGLLQHGDEEQERRQRKDLLWRLGTRVNDQQRRATSKCQTRWVSPLPSQTMRRTREATEMSKNLMWLAWAQDKRALKYFF